LSIPRAEQIYKYQKLRGKANASVDQVDQQESYKTSYENKSNFQDNNYNEL